MASVARTAALHSAELLRRRPAVLPPPLSASASVVLEACGIRLDLSGQRLSGYDLAELQRLAADADLAGTLSAMMQGEEANPTEHRAALHTALRARPGDMPAAPASVQNAVAAERERERNFAVAIRSGAWAGAGGQRITDVINIGIGGSDAGPRLVCQALQHVADGPRLHFVSNVDGSVLARLLPQLEPARTLVIVSSKSLTTRETLLNAAAARAWLEAAGISGSKLSQHMVVVSAKPKAAELLGLPPGNRFSLWDWVGGRFSVWSAVGLPAMLSLGPERFDALLDGARNMDRHALEAPPEVNLPVNLALVELWNCAVLQMPTLCVLPYDDRLAPMLSWLQQLQMESLGKSRRIDGAMSDIPTGPVVWGGIGTDAQHTFLQLLRQGTARTAVDVICVEQPDHGYLEHHKVLIANAHAQVEALVTADADSLAANAVSLISIDRLTPERLGSLMALYEHKVVMEAALLGINAFDQPGVELAKAVARRLERDEP